MFKPKDSVVVVAASVFTAEVAEHRATVVSATVRGLEVVKVTANCCWGKKNIWKGKARNKIVIK